MGNREEFEQYVKQKYPHCDLSRTGDDYTAYYVQVMWGVYQHFNVNPQKELL